MEQEAEPLIESLVLPSSAPSLRVLFDPFLSRNKLSTIDEIDLASGKVLAVKNPWGDPSVALKIPPNSDSLQDALNNVFLPERFTALWHLDTKDFEIVWTASPLNKEWMDIFGRAFAFSWKAHDYNCDFSRSSDRLLSIAESFEPVLTSSTNFRNLFSFKLFCGMQKVGDIVPSYEPRSFWIRNVDFEEEEVVELSQNLNFYMTYYDTRTPTIVVHPPRSEALATAPRTRYTAGRFPSQVRLRPLDDTLLTLWSACNEGDSAKKFLYGFRVIEYASYSFLDTGARREIRKLLSSPNCLEDLSVLTDSLASALQKSKGEDFQKLEALLTELVNPSLLWREINRNLLAFTEETVFDGGFKVGKLISVGAREEDFTPHAITVFHKAIRAIRNALAHGKDQRTAHVITPTTRNLGLLSPWVSLLLTAAAEVMLYKDLP